ncbi:MAG TPA: hypothetical protein VMW56_02905, partial [Candidatus Margulisiibacteriota bacterium]|nr:hypothetical protein [Candidatus Margulisiibacteriota bacterium]
HADAEGRELRRHAARLGEQRALAAASIDTLAENMNAGVLFAYFPPELQNRLEHRAIVDRRQGPQPSGHAQRTGTYKGGRVAG